MLTLLSRAEAVLLEIGGADEQVNCESETGNPLDKVQIIKIL